MGFQTYNIPSCYSSLLHPTSVLVSLLSTQLTSPIPIFPIFPLISLYPARPLSSILLPSPPSLLAFLDSAATPGWILTSEGLELGTAAEREQSSFVFLCLGFLPRHNLF